MVNGKKRGIEIGTVRVRAKDLSSWEKTCRGWKKSKADFPELAGVCKLFKKHGRFDLLVDNKNIVFLSGMVSSDGKCVGTRINILPDGRVLDRAYSLFSKNLAIHDESSNTHWDVIYQNPNGQFAYCYTLDKKILASRKKYDEVREFEKRYEVLERNALKALKDEKDFIAIPLYILLKTYMRVGNEIYYNANKHEGLTTMKKKDIQIKGNYVEFNYIGKDGVPISISEKFPDIFIKRLKKLYKMKKSDDFMFTNSGGHLLKDANFKEAFKRYCGKEFYPHIVRSFFATEQAKKFLKEHKRADKKEIKEFFNFLAEKLGHKKFDKKSNEWKDSYNVTVHYYIQPELVEKIKRISL